MPLTSEVDNMERLDNTRNPPSDGQDVLDPEVVVMEPSPTMYSEDKRYILQRQRDHEIQAGFPQE